MLLPSKFIPTLTSTQTDRDAQVIRLDMENTVETLRDQLQALLCAGHDDTGFPILRSDKPSEDLRMIGYIGANELEHALSIVGLPVTPYMC
jgi:chloride channel 3/4/5